MKFEETILSSETLYDGRIMKVERAHVRFPDGAEGDREIARFSDAVCLLALDDQNRALVVEQYRFPYAETLLELPAGKIDPGETPEATAVRELMEETGYRPGKLRDLGRFYPTVGGVYETLYLFLATDLVPASAKGDDDEFIEAYFMPLDELVDRILSGEVPDGKTQAAVLKYILQKEKNQL